MKYECYSYFLGWRGSCVGLGYQLVSWVAECNFFCLSLHIIVMVAGSSKSTDVCKRVLLKSLLRCLDRHFVPQLGFSQGIRTWKSAGGESRGFSNASKGSVIAVGMSGGVDSSTAALLLKRQGYGVFGMFMRNWDSNDEAGNSACSVEHDYEDAQRVCKHLDIKLYDVDYHRRYWMDVFESFTRDCAVGLTPNPDLACNQHIKVHHEYLKNNDKYPDTAFRFLLVEKVLMRYLMSEIDIESGELSNLRNVLLSFEHISTEWFIPQSGELSHEYFLGAPSQHSEFDALLENAKELGAERLATGHYARLLHPPGGKPVQLLRGIDWEKDQSYFLASVAGHALERVIFPLGSFHKSEVRKLAVSEGLITANKRSSAGICFVGRRNFTDFISQYVDMNSGPFIAVDDGSKVGTHEGIAAYTHGQRARIGGKAEASYVVGKDVPNNVVFVASGPNHPALFCTSAVSDSLCWIAGEPPPALAEGRVLRCLYKARYRQSVEECTVCLASAYSEEAIKQGLGVAGKDSGEFVPSSFCRLQQVPPCGQQLQVRFTNPARAITPGQALVLYDGDVCLGAGRLLHPGPTLFERNSYGGE